MNKLDEKVMRIFNLLVFGDTNRYSYKPYHKSGMLFNIEGVEVLLQWFKKTDKDKTTNDPIDVERYFNYDMFAPWAVCKPSDSGYTFYITVGENGRQLVVPPMDRVTEAKVLTRLEIIANEREEQELDLIIDHMIDEDD